MKVTVIEVENPHLDLEKEVKTTSTPDLCEEYQTLDGLIHGPEACYSLADLARFYTIERELINTRQLDVTATPNGVMFG
jgi:hypothetical protein